MEFSAATLMFWALISLILFGVPTAMLFQRKGYHWMPGIGIGTLYGPIALIIATGLPDQHTRDAIFVIAKKLEAVPDDLHVEMNNYGTPKEIGRRQAIAQLEKAIHRQYPGKVRADD